MRSYSSQCAACFARWNASSAQNVDGATRPMHAMRSMQAMRTKGRWFRTRLRFRGLGGGGAGIILGGYCKDDEYEEDEKIGWRW